MDGHTVTRASDISADARVARLRRRTRPFGRRGARVGRDTRGCRVAGVAGGATQTGTGTIARESRRDRAGAGSAKRMNVATCTLFGAECRIHALPRLPRLPVGGAGDAGAGRGRGGVAEVDLGLLEFAVVDLETTGWSPEKAAITEIGAVRVRAGARRGEFVRQGEFASLVNPGRPVPPGIADLTGITDWMLAAAPRLGAVLPGLRDFRRGLGVVAQNAPRHLRLLVAG